MNCLGAIFPQLIRSALQYGNRPLFIPLASSAAFVVVYTG